MIQTIFKWSFLFMMLSLWFVPYADYVAQEKKAKKRNARKKYHPTHRKVMK